MSRLKVDNIEPRSGNNVAIDNPMNLKSYTTTEMNALTATAGDIIFNSTDGVPYFHNGTSWGELAAPPISVSYLVIAGGGGGPPSFGGGGGAGGYRNSYASETSGANSSTETDLILSANTSYTVTIGAGGAAVSGGGQAEVFGTNGTNTTFGSHVTGFGGRGGYADNNSANFVDASTPLGIGSYGGTGTFAGSFMAGGKGGSNSDSGQTTSGTKNGGDALFGGGGGGGTNSSVNGTGGTSFFAGNGGSGVHGTGNAGSTPAGGGGGGRSTSGKGGDGECWVMVF